MTICLSLIDVSCFFAHNRYWNDPETFRKISQAMGPLGGPDFAEPSGTEGTEEEGEYEDESIVHHTASVGDDEVRGQSAK